VNVECEQLLFNKMTHDTDTLTLINQHMVQEKPHEMLNIIIIFSAISR